MSLWVTRPNVWYIVPKQALNNEKKRNKIVNVYANSDRIQTMFLLGIPLSINQFFFHKNH